MSTLAWRASIHRYRLSSRGCPTSARSTSRHGRMLHSRSAAAGKALLGAMLLRTSLPVALAAQPPSASPTQPAAAKSSLSRSRARLDGRACSPLAPVRESPREPAREERGESRRRRGGEGGAGRSEDGGDAGLAKQEMPARTPTPTAPGLNTAREGRAGREGASEVRARSDAAQSAAAGGRWVGGGACARCRRETLGGRVHAAGRGCERARRVRVV